MALIGEKKAKIAIQTHPVYLITSAPVNETNKGTKDTAQQLLLAHERQII
jgi:hypothetical protein